MKILIDALCADFGGIRTYVERLLPAWRRAFPEDDLHVLIGAESTIELAGIAVHRARIRRPTHIGRPWAQTTIIRRLVQQLNPDVFLATLPSTSLMPVRAPSVLVVHDLRHELRPEQFTWTQRLMRNLSYGRGYQLADAFISVSQRSLDDLRANHPATWRRPAVVAHHGSDHVATWPKVATEGGALAFAHHTNKNLSLILESWALDPDLPHLRVVGLDSRRRLDLQAELVARGLAERITLMGFLSESDFQRTFAAAGTVVFPSDFEGFGLPVIEAMRLGIPVVIGPERATMEIADGHAFVCQSFTPTALAHAMHEASGAHRAHIDAARAHAARMTWSAAAAASRGLLSSLLDVADPTRRGT